MPRTSAQARALSGFAAKNSANFGTSHSPRFPEPPNNSVLCAPPYKLSVVPAVDKVPVVSSRDNEVAVAAATDRTGSEMAFTGLTPFTPTNGSGPEFPTGSNVTTTCGTAT